METVIDWDQCVAKLVALGSDGAAIMLGKNSGVITLLQVLCNIKQYGNMI